MVWDLVTLERMNETAELKARVVALDAQIMSYKAALETSSGGIVSKFLKSKIRAAKVERILLVAQLEK